VKGDTNGENGFTGEEAAQANKVREARLSEATQVRAAKARGPSEGRHDR
jgi:hypothetical protein